MLLRFDAGRPILQRHAIDARAAGHAQRLDRLVDAARHCLGRVRIDDEDMFGHGSVNHTAVQSLGEVPTFEGEIS
jgi:hypothetical protein